ncbi:unnamed protein product [Adineta ricciae]|uniref:Uncharacterized protein n=1 Tax=Adineta ricciae TaxID=249248 RepID=A0A815QQH6_ADIRI|nr:unnamed protein product [Adineta ricciae]CAF1636980.1 unnamed protein product [Adineta ricciae]
MCDVFPPSLAFAMQACTQYRNRVLDNSSVRRLTELFDAHIGKREKRQLVEGVVGAAAVYGVYRIIGDLFGGNNDEIIHRLDESENFQRHQEKLDDILVTSVLSLEDSNLVLLESFKNLFDSVNATRSLIHNLLKMSLKQQRAFSGWAKFSLKSEMRRHYEQMISAFSRVANNDLNLDMFSPEQRTFVHEFLWNRIRSNLPVNFSASLAQFIPNLLVQQVISFVPVNESEIVYELNENDFNFFVETVSDEVPMKNETIELDSILPKIVGHARIENFFAIPSNTSRKKAHLYKITRLPLFVDERRAEYVANLPQYISIGEDGSSSEWFEHSNRKCTVDQKSRYMFCSVPMPTFNSIQHPCLRSIIFNTSTKDCLKETVDLSSPHIVKFTPNIHAISVHTSLQCFEKGDKRNQNVFSNITKVAIIKTRCNSFVSCGTLDFSSVGGICDNAESYIFSFNTTYENPFKLERSVNPLDVRMTDLNSMMDISSIIESIVSHRKQLEDTHTEFQSNIHRTLRTKVWPKVFLGIFLISSIVTFSVVVYTTRRCYKTCLVHDHWKSVHSLFHRFVKQKQVEVENLPLDMNLLNETSKQKDSSDAVIYEGRKVDHSYPLLNEAAPHANNHHSPYSSRSEKDVLSLKQKVNFDPLPLTNYISCNPKMSDDIRTEISYKKPNSSSRKIYSFLGESDLVSNHSSMTSREFSDEDHQSEE